MNVFDEIGEVLRQVQRHPGIAMSAIVDLSGLPMEDVDEAAAYLERQGMVTRTATGRLLLEPKAAP